MSKKPDNTQRERFEALARELEAEGGDADRVDDVIGSLGRHGPKTEAEAREEVGKPPRRT